jgi:hypothetical protein
MFKLIISSCATRSENKLHLEAAGGLGYKNRKAAQLGFGFQRQSLKEKPNTPKSIMKIKDSSVVLKLEISSPKCTPNITACVYHDVGAVHALRKKS